ncbi:hypothetical protein [Mitsuokella multacida]|uniref:hypothetical protein n=1 Tax=Mitsuokella multacida TaxID=52226 RepID=UPI002666D7FE|nr:hypothetical protein [Mitsuokella multacida]
MTREELSEYIQQGREIEFCYKGKMYSITYSPEGQDDYISFCEFYQEPSDVKTIDELIHLKRNGVSVIEMLESLSDKDIWIY